MRGSVPRGGLVVKNSIEEVVHLSVGAWARLAFIKAAQRIFLTRSAVGQGSTGCAAAHAAVIGASPSVPRDGDALACSAARVAAPAAPRRRPLTQWKTRSNDSSRTVVVVVGSRFLASQPRELN